MLFVCVHASAVKMSHLSAVPRSRCLIFWQEACLFVCSSVKVSKVCCLCVFTRVLSRCLIFRQFPVQDVSPFGGKCVVCVSARECCQDVVSFGGKRVFLCEFT